MVKVKWEAKGLCTKWKFAKQTWAPKVTESSFVFSMSVHLRALYLYDEPTNAHVEICPIIYYYSSTICSSHSCDHHQGVILQLVQKGRCMNILGNDYFSFSKIIIWLWMNKCNKKGIRFLNWFMTYNYTTHAPNSAPSIFLTTYLTPYHTQFSCDPFYWVQFHLSNTYIIIVTTVLPNIQLFSIPYW